MLTMNAVNHGDCLELMGYIPSGSVDMIKADLPFGTTNCAWDTVIDLGRMWAHYERIIKPTGAILLNAQTPFDKVLGASNLKMLRYEWIWQKTLATGFYRANRSPLKCHENILVFYKNPPCYIPLMTTGAVRKTIRKAQSNASQVYKQNTRDTEYCSDQRFPRSVLRFASDRHTLNLWPTQKPLALEEYLIATYTKKGDLVLDNCCGSGTTGRAAKNLGRRFILMEKNFDGFLITQERLKGETGK